MKLKFCKYCQKYHGFLVTYRGTQRCEKCVNAAREKNRDNARNSVTV